MKNALKNEPATKQATNLNSEFLSQVEKLLNNNSKKVSTNLRNNIDKFSKTIEGFADAEVLAKSKQTQFEIISDFEEKLWGEIRKLRLFIDKELSLYEEELKKLVLKKIKSKSSGWSKIKKELFEVEFQYVYYSTNQIVRIQSNIEILHHTILNSFIREFTEHSGIKKTESPLMLNIYFSIIVFKKDCRDYASHIPYSIYNRVKEYELKNM